jgi:hypothetical protein
MTRTALLRLVAPVALALAAVAWAAPSAEATRVGPPWISIESPPNPHDRATRDAFLVVRTYHHGDLLDQGVQGTAEGMVGTQRRSVRLSFAKTSQPGVYALRRQWPADGRWALVISTGPSEGAATALVTLDARNAQVAAVTVPTRVQDGWNVPRAVTRAEIDAALRTEVARGGR